MRYILLYFLSFVLVFVFGFYLNSSSYETPAFVKFERTPEIAEEAEEPPAIFPHLVHQEMFYCYVCHPSVFKFVRNVMTHDDFDNGKFCGACHNGVISWHVDDAPDCEVCHK
jgi:c(7)-type cytochrome triheme protein